MGQIGIALTYWVNGLLAALYGFGAQWPAWTALGLAAFAALAIDARHARQAAAVPARYAFVKTPGAPRRVLLNPATLGLGVLWAIVAWITPAPIPYIGVAMWLGSLTPLLLPLHQRRALHKLRWFIGIYALLVLGFWAVVRFPLSPVQAAAWSERLRAVGAGESLEAVLRAQFIPYIALLIWGILPLSYFGYLAQQLLAQRTTLRSPFLSLAERLQDLRWRGEADA